MAYGGPLFVNSCYAAIAVALSDIISFEPKLKAYSEMANEENSFVRDIEGIVDTAGIPITVVCDTAPVNRGSKHIYLSDSSFFFTCMISR